jgi:hypothetical protein
MLARMKKCPAGKKVKSQSGKISVWKAHLWLITSLQISSKNSKVVLAKDVARYTQTPLNQCKNQYCMTSTDLVAWLSASDAPRAILLSERLF